MAKIRSDVPEYGTCVPKYSNIYGWNLEEFKLKLRIQYQQFIYRAITKFSDT